MNQKHPAKLVLLFVLSTSIYRAISFKRSLENNAFGHPILCFEYAQTGENRSPLKICSQKLPDKLGKLVKDDTKIIFFDLETIFEQPESLVLLENVRMVSHNLQIIQNSVAIDYSQLFSQEDDKSAAEIVIGTKQSNLTLQAFIPMNYRLNEEPKQIAVGFCSELQNSSQFLIVYIEVSENKFDYHPVYNSHSNLESFFSENKGLINQYDTPQINSFTRAETPYEYNISAGQGGAPVFTVKINLHSQGPIQHRLLKIAEGDFNSKDPILTNSVNNESYEISANPASRLSEIPFVGNDYYMLILRTQMNMTVKYTESQKVLDISISPNTKRNPQII